MLEVYHSFLSIIPTPLNHVNLYVRSILYFYVIYVKSSYQISFINIQTIIGKIPILIMFQPMHPIPNLFDNILSIVVSPIFYCKSVYFKTIQSLLSPSSTAVYPISTEVMIYSFSPNPMNESLHHYNFGYHLR